MPVTDLKQLANLTKQANTVSSVVTDIVKANSDGDWLTRLERILNVVNNIVEKLPKQQPENVVNVQPNQRIEHPMPNNALPKQISAPVENNEKEQKVMDISKVILAKLEPELNKAIKKNPEMPIGEFIANLELMTVTEIKQLIQLLKLGEIIK